MSSVSPVHRERAVRLWACLENMATAPNYDKKFMTSDDEVFVRQILACDSKIKDYCKQGVDPSTLQLQESPAANYVSALDLHSRIVLECCHTLLKTYLVPVPEASLFNLICRIIYSSKQGGYNHGRHVLSCQRNMVLVNMMTKLCLQGTVIPEKASSIHDVICEYCWNAINYLHSSKILRHAHKLIMILLAYGYIQLTQTICDNLSQINSQRAVVTYCICVSMLPHSIYEAYRLEMQTQEKRFQEATANGNSVDDRVFCMLFKELKKISKNGHFKRSHKNKVL